MKYGATLGWRLDYIRNMLSKHPRWMVLHPRAYFLVLVPLLCPSFTPRQE
uniref:Uncharacterized protein n=1 Tax=Picea glauca TaxID=3330 RepID=A0A117NH53_PICGL|nr:hypothetical protein ABT39_MTgene4821 [Picea glauca]